MISGLIEKQAKQLTKPRLVAAMMSELDASRSVIVATCVESGKVYQSLISSTFKVPFEQSEVYFETQDDSSKLLSCICCFAGQRITFELERKSEKSWFIPRSVTVLELRSSSRASFVKGNFSAEVITERAAIYGFAVDINNDYLALEFDSDHHLDVGHRAQVLVRLVNSNCDIFYSSCEIVQASSSPDHNYKVILQFKKWNESPDKNRRFERYPVTGHSLQIYGSPFAESSKEQTLTILNVSSGGMTVSQLSASSQDVLLPGMIVSSKNPEISYIVIWKNDRILGIRPLISESEKLSRWYRLLDRLMPADESNLQLTRNQIAKILTRSGLLKGHRREPFGRDLSKHLVVDAESVSPLLQQKRVIVDSQEEIVLHVNLKRISESSWLFADGAALSEEKGAFNQLLVACIRHTKSLMQTSGLLPRFLTFIWAKAVKSSGEFAQELKSQGFSQLFDSVQISIKSFVSQNLTVLESNSDVKWSLTLVSVLSSQARRELNLQFTPMLFEALMGLDGSHPILNSELSRLGPYHRAVSKVVFVESKMQVVAHRILTHNIWSTTGVSNSVFVIVPKHLSSDQLIRCLIQLADDEISFGTDDFLIIFDGPSGENDQHMISLNSSKPFSFLVHDLFSNQELDYKDHKDKM